MRRSNLRNARLRNIAALYRYCTDAVRNLYWISVRGGNASGSTEVATSCHFLCARGKCSCSLAGCVAWYRVLRATAAIPWSGQCTMCKPVCSYFCTHGLLSFICALYLALAEQILHCSSWNKISSEIPYLEIRTSPDEFIALNPKHSQIKNKMAQHAQSALWKGSPSLKRV